MIITYSDKRDLVNLFKKLFENSVGDVLETRIHGKLSLYMMHYEDYDFLENFVKEYFIMREIIVDSRNSMIEYKKSPEYKDETLLNKIIITKELKYWQKLCQNINKFEKEFYKKTNISLLRVENEVVREKNQESQNRSL